MSSPTPTSELAATFTAESPPQPDQFNLLELANAARLTARHLDHPETHLHPTNRAFTREARASCRLDHEASPSLAARAYSALRYAHQVTYHPEETARIHQFMTTNELPSTHQLRLAPRLELSGLDPITQAAALHAYLHTQAVYPTASGRVARASFTLITGHTAPISEAALLDPEGYHQALTLPWQDYLNHWYILVQRAVITSAPPLAQWAPPHIALPLQQKEQA